MNTLTDDAEIALMLGAPPAHDLPEAVPARTRAYRHALAAAWRALQETEEWRRSDQRHRLGVLRQCRTKGLASAPVPVEADPAEREEPTMRLDTTGFPTSGRVPAAAKSNEHPAGRRV